MLHSTDHAEYVSLPEGSLYSKVYWLQPVWLCKWYKVNSGTSHARIRLPSPFTSQGRLIDDLRGPIPWRINSLIPQSTILITSSTINLLLEQGHPSGGRSRGTNLISLAAWLASELNSRVQDELLAVLVSKSIGSKNPKRFDIKHPKNIGYCILKLTDSPLTT